MCDIKEKEEPISVIYNLNMMKLNKQTRAIRCAFLEVLDRQPNKQLEKIKMYAKASLVLNATVETLRKNSDKHLATLIAADAVVISVKDGKEFVTMTEEGKQYLKLWRWQIKNEMELEMTQVRVARHVKPLADEHM